MKKKSRTKQRVTLKKGPLKGRVYHIDPRRGQIELSTLNCWERAIYMRDESKPGTFRFKEFKNTPVTQTGAN